MVKLRSLALLSLFLSVVLGSPLFSQKDPSQKSIEGSNDIGTPCSTNVSNAYLNVVLMIDVSTKMSTENLRQLTFNLQNAFSGVRIGNFWDLHTSGFAVIAYADQAKVIANLTQIKKQSDLAQALSISSLKQAPLSTSNSAAGIRDAYKMANAILDDYGDNCNNCTIWRNTAYIFVGASMNGVDIKGLKNDIYDVDNNYYDSYMTINANPSDPILTAVFNNISHFLNTNCQAYSAFNFSINDKNFYDELTYALTQAVCTCSGRGELVQYVSYNETTYRWTRYADCYTKNEYSGYGNVPAYELCTKNKMPAGAAITSKAKYDFIQQTFLYNADIKVYIGLHRNAQQDFVWTDYDGSEFPIGNFGPWAVDFDDFPGDCVAEINLNYNTTMSPLFVWEPTTCSSSYVLILCQDLACDADYTGCSSNNPLPEPKIGRREMLK